MVQPVRPIVALTVGDPAGIGPELLYQAVVDKLVQAICRPLIVGNASVLKAQWSKLALPMTNVRVIRNPQEAVFASEQINILDVGDPEIRTDIPFGKIDRITGIITMRDVERAVQLAVDGIVQAVVAGPHTKKSIDLAGIPFDGYPSLVAQLTNTPYEDTFLMLITGALRVVNVTLHMSLQSAVNAVKKDLVQRAIQAAAQTVQRIVSHPVRVAVAGLNPHAGEFGLFGREEIEEIGPAIELARTSGIQVTGPIAADTLFQPGVFNQYDVCVAMYHDQAHIPIKLLGSHTATALTVGTPVLFATVAHGSALDIAGTGIAEPMGLIEAIRRVTLH